MSRAIKCVSCGELCSLEDSLNGVLCPECCEDMGFDDEYEDDADNN